MTFTIAHRLATLKCDRLLVIADGKVIEQVRRHAIIICIVLFVNIILSCDRVGLLPRHHVYQYESNIIIPKAASTQNNFIFLNQLHNRF